jgi:hypothetical protein
MKNFLKIFNIIQKIYIKLIKNNLFKYNNLLSTIIKHLFKTYFVITI